MRNSGALGYIGLTAFVLGDIWLGIGILIYNFLLFPKIERHAQLGDRMLEFFSFSTTWRGWVLLLAPLAVITIGMVLIGISIKSQRAS